jgi:hypothetical protein
MPVSSSHIHAELKIQAIKAAYENCLPGPVMSSEKTEIRTLLSAIFLSAVYDK